MLGKNLGKQPALSVFVIATNRYTEFLPGLLESIDSYCMPNEIVEVIILTDNLNFPIGLKLNGRIRLKIEKIQSYVWPEATLLRYKLMSNFWNLAYGRLVMYLDADTRFINYAYESDFKIALNGKPIGLVAHPGYFNRNFAIKTLNRLSFKIGWERRMKSNAYVPLWRRKTYVCGGVWMGENKELHKLVDSLAETVKLDLDLNLIAKFHDESHLNMWLSKHAATVSVLTPEWAFEPSYSNLKNLKPFIEVLKKPAEFNALKQH